MHRMYLTACPFFDPRGIGNKQGQGMAVLCLEWAVGWCSREQMRAGVSDWL
jgi:hypothetical protein